MGSLTKLLGLILTFATLSTVSGGNILMLLAQASQSHKNVFQPLVEALSERNHTITIVSPYMGKPRKNVREIVPNNMAETSKKAMGNAFEVRKKGIVGLFAGFQFIYDACEETFQNSEFRALEKETFDLIFVDAFLNDCQYGWIHKTQVPFVLMVTAAAPSYITQAVGNRLPPSFIPIALTPFSDHMNLGERITNVLAILIWDLLQEFYFASKYEPIYRKHLGEDLPSTFEIMQNTSMVFANSHFALTFPRPHLPDVVEVGGMHCRPAKPLPKGMEEFVSGAKDGLILFSLGSVIQGKDMPDEVRQKFLNAFSRLKQRVLWKWESEDMPGLPPNVKLSKWVPQQDVLGHPNTKLFITHGGLLSTQEATYNGVPLIGIPIFGDQNLNMKQAERAGYALTIEILEFTEDGLLNAINEILTNQKYSQRAKELSTIFRDQMETPLERALFWTEYLLRHRGAPHLRSAARNLNFIQYYCLDVLAAILAILVVILWVSKLVISKLLRLVFPGRKDSAKKNN